MVSSGVTYKTPDEATVLQKLLQDQLRGRHWDDLLKKLHDKIGTDDFWLLRAVAGVGLPSPMTLEMVNNYLDMLDLPELREDDLVEELAAQIKELW